VGNYSYAWEKLHAAVLILAGGSGTRSERLRDAYVSTLMRLVPERDFPDNELRERFLTLTGDIAPGGPNEVALAGWPDDDLKRLAEAIVSLYARITCLVA